MPRTVSASEVRRRLTAAQREAQRQVDREIRKVNQHNKKVVDDHNRKVDQHNKKVVADYNHKVDQHNRRQVSEFNKRLQRSQRPTTATFTVEEQRLAERVQGAVAVQEDRDRDLFLSYARADGSEVANQLRTELEQLDVSIWFDELAIHPGQSQALQMDRGLRLARAGVVLLTPVYLTGRFWPQRELGALLHKATLIPVLHGVTFEDVARFSGILPDLAGFTTAQDSIEVIAEKIAAAVLVPETV